MSSAEIAQQDLQIQDIDTLYRGHHSWLHAWLRRRLGNAFDAADLAHDTYLRILQSGRLPQPQQSRAFLTQVAKGLVMDLHRKRQLEDAYQMALAQLPEQSVPSLETQAIVLQTLMRIDRALHALPARVRESFLLSQLDGLTYSQIAAQLGVSVGAVRKYMLKAADACLCALEGNAA
jgi:RNA polymerase sigma factor (sigma-70 family)